VTGAKNKMGAATDNTRTATFLVYDGMWRSGGIQSIIIRIIHNIKSHGGSVWVVCNWDLPVLGVPETHILYDKALIGQDWSSSKKFSEFNTFQIIAFGPSATPTAYLLENYIKLGRRSADVFMSINVLHPHEFMMKDEKIHVHFMNRLLALAVGPSKLVFMNEQCRITHSTFLGRDLSSNRIVPVPIDERQPRWMVRSSDEPIRIICVGRIVNFKAYNFALPGILDKLVDEGRSVTCDIFGYGSEEGKLANLVKQCNVSDLLRFHGPIPLEKFDDLVSGYDLFIGMGTAALQAAQLGVPTILTIVDDEHGAHGFINSAPFGNLGEKDPYAPRLDLKQTIEVYLNASPRERETISLAGISYANRYVSDNYVENLTKSSLLREGISRHLAALYCRFYLWMARDNWLRKAVWLFKAQSKSGKPL